MEDPIGELVRLLSRLPGIGERTATRLAHHVLGLEPDYAVGLGTVLRELHARVHPCSECGNYATEALCRVCADPRRDASRVCVVARPPDVSAIERSGGYQGHYYVMHKLLSPLDGVGPEELRISPLMARVEAGAVAEVILATPLNVEGEATALYLARVLKPHGVRCSRIASGLPHGGELEYTDQVTLGRAIEGRRDV
jgi:recombination protein RecR